ncbi:hypothetical protein ABNR98_004423 [Salmonella enterica]
MKMEQNFDNAGRIAALAISAISIILVVGLIMTSILGEKFETTNPIINEKSVFNEKNEKSKKQTIKLYND